MKFDPQIHRRHSIRLKEYDYTLPGGYFVTIVTSQRVCSLGKIVNGEMKLSPLGKIAHFEWLKTSELRSNVELYEDQFIVMPNHVHGIIWIIENDVVVGAERRSTPTEIFLSTRSLRRSAPTTNSTQVAAGSLGAIIRAYKSAVTYKINEMRTTRGTVVWQRNYYEHVIRNQHDLEQIHKYIKFNPNQWAKDEENPEWKNPH